MKNILIGIFVLAAFCIIIFMILFLHPTSGDKGEILKVRFADIDKINVGTRVTFAGKPVGEVISINELPQAINERISHNGAVYAYELELRVDSSVNVFNTDEIALRTSGLLGEKTVAIIPKAPTPGQALRSITNEVIYATESGTVEQTFKEFKEVADKADVALDRITVAMDEILATKLINHIAVTAKNAAEISTSLNKPEVWDETLDNVNKLSVNLADASETLQTGLTSFADTTLNTKKITDTTNLLIERINTGEGTIGRIIVKDDLYLKTSALLSKADTVLNDINHYGLMFQTDSGWKRLRARRLNLLQKLESPQEFRNYFNDELDQITTSLERVEMIVNTSGCRFPYLMSDCEFGKVFAELLRKVDGLQEDLKMYNIQIAEEEAKRTELAPCRCCLD